MRHRIVTQNADLAVLLRYLCGEYRTPRSSRITAWAVAGVCGAVGMSSAADLYRWSPASGDDRSALVIAILLPAGLAAFLLNQTYTSYHFTPDWIERRTPLPLGNRKVATGNVHEGYLLTDRGFALELIPAEGSRLVIPLEGSVREDFAKLYTEIGTDASLVSPVLDARYRSVIYGVVIALVVVFVVIAVALTKRGLLAW